MQDKYYSILLNPSLLLRKSCRKVTAAFDIRAEHPVLVLHIGGIPIAQIDIGTSEKNSVTLQHLQIIFPASQENNLMPFCAIFD